MARSVAAGTPTPPSASPARRALLTMSVFVGVLWVVQLADSVSGYPLLRFGIEPRDVDRLDDVVTAPFIHLSWTHLLGNTVPLFVLGFFVALSGLRRFFAVTAVVILVSGLGVWCTAATHSDTVGASGVVFGYFGYLVARGLLDRRLLDLLVGILVGVLYWTILPDLLPGHRGVSWQAHVFGLAGGVASAWLFRRRGDRARPERTSPAPGAATAAPGA